MLIETPVWRGFPDYRIPDFEASPISGLKTQDPGVFIFMSAWSAQPSRVNRRAWITPTARSGRTSGLDPWAPEARGLGVPGTPVLGVPEPRGPGAPKPLGHRRPPKPGAPGHIGFQDIYRRAQHEKWYVLVGVGLDTCILAGIYPTYRDALATSFCLSIRSCDVMSPIETRWRTHFAYRNMVATTFR